MAVETGKIKNIALVGHNGSGKTSLAEAILHKCGASDRFGKVTDGTTVCDYDAEEIKRKYTINTALASFSYDSKRINILDTPGLFDFAGGMHEAVATCDTAIITVAAVSGIKTGDMIAFELAEKYGKSKMFAVTKMDDPNADYYALLTKLKTKFGQGICPIVIPVIENGETVSYIDLLEMKNFKYDTNGNSSEIPMPADGLDGKIETFLSEISEAVAEVDDTLMEKFFEGEEFTHDEIVSGIHKGMVRGIITPVVCTSAATLIGIDLLLNKMSAIFPSPNEKPLPSATDKTGKEIAVSCDSNDPVSAFVFKTVADPFVGKMTFMKIMSGTLTPDTELVNANTGHPEKISKILRLMGKKQEEAGQASAGDIVVTTKISAETSETLCSPKRVIKFGAIEFPAPCYSMAVHARTQGDETKMSGGIKRLLEEDKTMTYTRDSITGEQIISGLGEQHLDIAVSKLKVKFGADVDLTVPRIAYRETIRQKVKVQGRHKKQSGGHGQFGDVHIEFEPCDSTELVFEEKIFGGAVPKNYFPAVEKGLQESMKKGVLAGCPVSGLKATLVDGSYHPVDSSEMAFKMAASIAFKEGLKKANPVMLEPIGALKVIVPDENTGDVMGELNKRRGRVNGMNPVGKGMTEVDADVPMREMHDFAMYIRQTAKGMGSFTCTFERYEQLPANLLDEVVASVAAE
ncbi:MAG: elongation factor G [Oscillospiraceae bacterium]|jgi:elongation factor G|nr:elongation factor G [Oscillospiraceae bacterium]